MQFYVSWVSHDPEYQQYDSDCSLLVSPIHQPKSWHVGRFGVLPKRLMLDSGSYYLLRRSGVRFSARDILDSQLNALGDYWRVVQVTICHFDYPVMGSNIHEVNTAIETTLANAYDLKAELLQRPDWQELKENVRFLGVIQGTTPESIRFCAQGLLALDFFDSFGLGSLAPLMDPREISLRVAAAQSVIGTRDLHAFGVSSLAGMRRLRDLGVKSVDSARPIKAAIHCTVFYGSPLRGYTVKGTLKRAVEFITRPKECSCPVCQVHRRDLLKVGKKTYNNYRAIHNYLQLKRELCGS